MIVLPLRANVNMQSPLHRYNHNNVRSKSLIKQFNTLLHVCACCTGVTNCENHKKKALNTCGGYIVLFITASAEVMHDALTWPETRHLEGGNALKLRRKLEL